MAIAYTATVSGFDYGFDFVDQDIEIDSGVDSLPVEDFYTAIKEAQASEAGIVFEPISYASGLDELDEGIQTFITVSLEDEWEVKTLKTSGKFTTRGGNIVKDNKKDPFLDNPNVTYIGFFSQAGVKTTTEVGSGVNEEDIVDIVRRTKDAIYEEITGDYNLKQHLNIQTNSNNTLTDDGIGGAVIFKSDGTTPSLTYSYEIDLEGNPSGSRVLVSVDAD